MRGLFCLSLLARRSALASPPNKASLVSSPRRAALTGPASVGKGLGSIPGRANETRTRQSLRQPWLTDAAQRSCRSKSVPYGDVYRPASGARNWRLGTPFSARLSDESIVAPNVAFGERSPVDRKFVELAHKLPALTALVDLAYQQAQLSI